MLLDVFKANNFQDKLSEEELPDVIKKKNQEEELPDTVGAQPKLAHESCRLLQ